MTEVPIRLPVNGLSENVAFSDQEPATTRDARNVRSQDPGTGRKRISQRSGLSKFNTNQLNSSNKVRDLVQVTYDSRNVDWAAGSSPQQIDDAVWSKSTPSGDTACYQLDVDRQGNVYALDGDKGVVKYSADGTQVWTLSLPVAATDDKVRAIFVDPLDGNIYVSVSVMEEATSGRIWRYQEAVLGDGTIGTELVWEVQTTSITQRLTIKNDKLYCAQFDQDLQAGAIRVYDNLDGNAPILIRQIFLPKPLGIAVKDDGSIIACGQDQQAFAIDWNPSQLTTSTGISIKDRIYRWHRAHDVSEFDVGGDFVSGADVLRWPDISGNERELFFNTATNPPKLRLKAQGIWPSIKFEAGTGLDARPNTSIEASFKAGQQSMFPAYSTGMFAAFFVLRCDSQATLYTLAAQNSDSGTRHELIVNANSSSSATADSFKWFTDNTSGATTPSAGAYSDGVLLVTILYDGGVNPGMSSTTDVRSLLRVNGEPIDRFESNEMVSLIVSTLGHNNGVAGAAGTQLVGEILEFIVIDREGLATPTNTNREPITHEAFPDLAAADQGDNEVTRIEGYLMHKYSLQAYLPDNTSSHTHPFGQDSNDIAGPPPDGSTSAWIPLLYGPPPATADSNWVAKFAASGEIVWSIDNSTDEDLDGGGASNIGGLGLDVALDSNGDIFSVGPQDGVDPQTVDVIKLIDQGTSVSADPTDGAWGFNLQNPYGSGEENLPRLGVDTHDNVYVPFNGITVGGAFRVLKGSDGTSLYFFQDTGATSVVPHPIVPDYDGDLTNPTAEFCYVSMLDDPNGVTTGNVHKLRMPVASAATGSPRTQVIAGVAGGNIVTFADSGSVTTVGTGSIDTTSQYVQSVQHFGKVYYADGTGDIQIFDPQENTVAALVADSGPAPLRVKILESWRGRLVACRAQGLIDEAFNWKMSAIDKPLDWNTFPPVRDSAQSIAGDNAIGPGLVPDIVNGFVPYNDDLAYFLCDHSIWMLNGDPMDGGQFDLVSDITGGAFGRAWAKDPDGNIFFFGSRGGLYVMRPGRIPERVSLHNIERRLQNVDLSTHYIRLAWNYRDEGLHIIQCPFGAGGTQVLHYFWDAKFGAMWEDTYGSTSDTTVQPTAVTVIDGDDVSDRVIIFGSEDGYVRRWDENAFDDDTIPIDAYVTMGPLAGPDPVMETRFVGPHVILANDQDGARYDLFAVTEPDDLNASHRSGDLQPGVNSKRRDRVRGLYCYLQLRNAQRAQRFAVETVTMDAYPAGIKRARRLQR